VRGSNYFMTYSDLLDTASRLARPCKLLKYIGTSEDFAGVWGGAPTVSTPGEKFKHWLSIDCRFIPKGIAPTHGVISVFTNEADCASGLVAFDVHAKLTLSGGKPLFAHDAQSYPPPDVLSEEHQDAYIPIWQANCPLYTEEAVAVLGGWHFPWPDGDWAELREKPLLLWTIEDSEPWVEVWGESAGFKVIQRIT